jgi:hypothetical protein
MNQGQNLIKASNAYVLASMGAVLLVLLVVASAIFAYSSDIGGRWTLTDGCYERMAQSRG